MDPGTIAATAAKVASTAPVLIKFALRFTSKEMFKSGSRALDAAIVIAKDSEPRAMTQDEKQAQLELLNDIDWLKREQPEIEAYVEKRFSTVTPSLRSKIVIWQRSCKVAKSKAYKSSSQSKWTFDFAIMSNELKHDAMPSMTLPDIAPQEQDEFDGFIHDIQKACTAALREASGGAQTEVMAM